MLAIYSSLLAVLCYDDTNALDSTSNRQIRSSPSSHAALDNPILDESETFIPLIDIKHISNSKTYDNSFKNLNPSELFQNIKKKKIHVLSSASASALLSSSTLSVDELPKPQIQKQTPTGATAVSKKKDGKHHRHEHNNKHHSKKRHHKVHNNSTDI